jgi:hypothetical protein
MRHKQLLKIAQWVFTLVVIGFAARGVILQWELVRERVTELSFHWLPILFASAIVLTVYALLIALWRQILAAWDTMLAWRTAARIWFAASLGKYVPGYIWSLTAVGMMSRDAGASGVAAAGSSLIVNALNLASGLTVALICGARLIPQRGYVAFLVATAVVAAAAMPKLLPYSVTWVSRVTGRNIPVPRIPLRTLWTVFLGTGLAWVGYGVAFHLFITGIFAGSDTQGALPLYIAVYTGAYILGLLAPSPAGLGVREAGIIEGLRLFGAMSQADAAIVAVTARLWLTVLEIVPGIIALAVSHTTVRPRHA